MTDNTQMPSSATTQSGQGTNQGGSDWHQVGKLQVQIDRVLCIGAATCVAVAPQAFQLDNEAKAIVLPTAGNETEQTIIDAARSCPVAAIIVKDATDKQVFP